MDDGRFTVTFRYCPSAGTKSVYLAGSFNDWHPTAIKMDGPDAFRPVTRRSSSWRRAYHEYKFVLDGTRWRQDPSNLSKGGGFYHNSVVEVGKAPAPERAGRRKD